MIRKFSSENRFHIPPAFIALMCKQIIQSSVSYGFPVWVPPAGSHVHAYDLTIKPFARAIGCPWNAGPAGCLIETGILPFEILWEYMALSFGSKLFKSNSIALKSLSKEFHQIPKSNVCKTNSPLGAVLKLLEIEWKVSSHTVKKSDLLRKRSALTNKYLEKKGYSLSVMKFKTNIGKTAPYLWLPNEFASCVFRFRNGYGPDLCSLIKRGLYRNRKDICRLCNSSPESRFHILCECPFSKAIQPSSWRSMEVSWFLSDSSFEHEDFFRIAAFLKSLYNELSGRIPS